MFPQTQLRNLILNQKCTQVDKNNHDAIFPPPSPSLFKVEREHQGRQINHFKLNIFEGENHNHGSLLQLCFNVVRIHVVLLVLKYGILFLFIDFVRANTSKTRAINKSFLYSQLAKKFQRVLKACAISSVLVDFGQSATIWSR